MNVALDPHLADAILPSGWSWGTAGFLGSARHYQELTDNLGRSLSLVSAPDLGHHGWICAEARTLASISHPSIPAPYALWNDPEQGFPVGYVRRWIVGETLRQHVARGARDYQAIIRVLRLAASALATVHDGGRSHGGVAPEALWLTPSGRCWLMSWQWSVAAKYIPIGQTPDRESTPWAPEWVENGWAPTPLSDQWQLAASLVSAWAQCPIDALIHTQLDELLPEFPASFRQIVARALDPNPKLRYPTLLILIRELERTVTSPSKLLVTSTGTPVREETLETSLRRVTVDDYEVISLLGEGAHGSVWRVRDLALGRYVALKIVRPALVTDADAMRSFTREARLAAGLAHPGIVPVYDWEAREGIHWYTMELAENGSLADLVERQGPRDVSEIDTQVSRLLSALEAAHEAGIVHRDLKPENILISRWGAWRLSDFGIADAEGDLTLATTPGFSAPEQMLKELVTSKADLWAMGALLWYAMTGQAPVSGDARAQVRQQVTLDFDGGEGLHPIVRQWLFHLMAPSPESRPSSASEALAIWRRDVRPALAVAARTPAEKKKPLVDQLFPSFSRPFRR